MRLRGDLLVNTRRPPGFGPGAIAQARAVDEYVPIDQLVRAAQVIAVTAVRFCGVETG